MVLVTQTHVRLKREVRRTHGIRTTAVVVAQIHGAFTVRSSEPR